MLCHRLLTATGLAVCVFLASGCAHHRSNNNCCTKPAVVGSVPIGAPAPAPCCNGAPVPLPAPPGAGMPPPPPAPVFSPSGKQGVIVPQY